MRAGCGVMTCAVIAATFAGAAWAQPTQLAPVYARPCPVRLNEVMVNPGTYGDRTGEFIELYNTSATQSVDIAGWLVSDGEDTDRIVDFTGPHDMGQRGTSIPPLGFAIIVDSDYNGVFNSFLADVMDWLDATECDRWDFIMVRVDDQEIGNGLDNRADGITITTNWPLLYGRSTPCQTRSMSWAADRGFAGETSSPSLEFREHVPAGEYIYQPSEGDEGFTPGTLNSDQWPEC